MGLRLGRPRLEIDIEVRKGIFDRLGAQTDWARVRRGRTKQTKRQLARIVPGVEVMRGR